MLSAIKNVQVIVHLTLLDVIVPGNAQIFFGAIAEMVAFDPIELDELIDFGFRTRPEDDYELVGLENFTQLGYESRNFLVNLGGLRLVLLIQILLIPILVASAMMPWCCQKLSMWFKKKVDSIFFTSIYTFIDSTFLVIFIIGLLNVREVYNGHLEVDTSFWIAISALAVCVIEFVSVGLFLKYCQKRLD